MILLGATVWVSLDARAIGDDKGRMPGIVHTKPVAWAAGVFLALIIVLPIYLMVRVRYKRLLAERKAQAALLSSPSMQAAPDLTGIWPPPPRQPAD
jgi:hypothetical protein